MPSLRLDCGRGVQGIPPSLPAPPALQSLVALTWQAGRMAALKAGAGGAAPLCYRAWAGWSTNTAFDPDLTANTTF